MIPQNERPWTPHTLRHTLAMNLLQSGVDITVIALWLGHESIETTQMYLQADMEMKAQALARTAPAIFHVDGFLPMTDCSPSLNPSDYAASTGTRSLSLLRKRADPARHAA